MNTSTLGQLDMNIINPIAMTQIPSFVPPARGNFGCEQDIWLVDLLRERLRERLVAPGSFGLVHPSLDVPSGLILLWDTASVYCSCYLSAL